MALFKSIVHVIRNGELIEISSKMIVPGDIVRL